MRHGPGQDYNARTGRTVTLKGTTTAARPQFVVASFPSSAAARFVSAKQRKLVEFSGSKIGTIFDSFFPGGGAYARNAEKTNKRTTSATAYEV